MTAEGFLPRRFGTFLLTAALGQDAMGRAFRGLRISGQRCFVRLRMLEGPEISDDAVLDAIQESGEIHSFLKNPAIARGAQMDAVEGVPFIAWNEPSGRTLDSLLAKARQSRQPIPFEHALLIAEKVATALDHAYNTTIDGERTLHGLVWPGFVSLSDDGETQLTGFGLAQGFFPSLSKPRFSREVAAYLAPEERANLKIEKNSDVYSVGALLFELMAGRLPSLSDPLGDLRMALREAPPILPETATVLRLCLSPAAARYQSSGELRRELGKLLFSGPYSPSTFNLAFFLNNLFGTEIEAENKARGAEASLDPGSIREQLTPSSPPAAKQSLAPTAASKPSSRVARPKRRAPLAIGGALLLAAAIAGTIYLISQRAPSPAPPVVSPPVRPTAIPAVTPTITSPAGPAASTSAMSEAQFQGEVSRRLAQQVKRFEEDLKKRRSQNLTPGEAVPRSAPAASSSPAPPTPLAELPTATSSPKTELPAATPLPRPSPPAAAEPTRAPMAETAAPRADEAETPPKILRAVKPVYPPIALRARVSGIVVLRVLVSEAGDPLQVEIVKAAKGGLSEAAIAAVRKWKFEPARRNGVPLKAWTTIPIPFEP